MLPKKLAIITSHAPSLTNFRAPLIHMLFEKGIQVLALAPNYDEETREAVEMLGATSVDCSMARTGINPMLDIINTWRLSSLLRNLKPDVSLGYFIKPVVFGTLAAWFAGVPRRFAMIEGLGYAFTLSNDSLTIKRRLFKWLVLLLYKIGLSRAEQVIFLNPDDQAELVEKSIVSAQKTFLLGGIGVDLNLWVPSPPLLHPVTFLLVARLLREKGIVQFAEAARIVKKKYKHVRFILLGGMDDNPGSISESELLSWVDEGILEWHGHVRVQPWMSQTSVFVLPSYREGVPVSTQEAMASGRPVITTDVPGCRETVVDGINGFLVPPRNSEALAAAMCRFIEQPELIVSMGRESRRMAEERFDVYAVNQRLIALLLNKND